LTKFFVYDNILDKTNLSLKNNCAKKGTKPLRRRSNMDFKFPRKEELLGKAEPEGEALEKVLEGIAQGMEKYQKERQSFFVALPKKLSHSTTREIMLQLRRAGWIADIVGFVDDEDGQKIQIL